MRALPGGAAPSTRLPSDLAPRGGIGLSRAPPANAANRNFSIFKDGDSSSLDNSSALTRAGPRSMPSESVISKENIQVPGKWTSNALGGSAPITLQTTISVFRDPESITQPPPPSSAPIRAPERPVLAATAPVQRVQLKNFARERGQSRMTDQGYLGYDPSPLYAGEEELCFEEVRAMQWRARAPSPSPAIPPAPAAQTISQPQQQRGITTSSPPSHPHAPSPTITTKIALQDVYAMFGPSSNDIPVPSSSEAGPFAMESGTVSESFPNTTVSSSVLAAAPRFAVFCDEEERSENAENIPPSNKEQAAAAAGAQKIVPGLSRRPALQAVVLEPLSQEEA